MLNRKGLTVYLEVAKHCFHALFTCRSILPFSIVTPPADRIDSRQYITGASTGGSGRNLHPNWAQGQIYESYVIYKSFLHGAHLQLGVRTSLMFVHHCTPMQTPTSLCQLLFTKSETLDSCRFETKMRQNAPNPISNFHFFWVSLGAPLRKKFYSKLQKKYSRIFTGVYSSTITTVNYRNYQAYSFYYSNITRVYFSENPIVFYSISYCSKLQ